MLDDLSDKDRMEILEAAIIAAGKKSRKLVKFIACPKALFLLPRHKSTVSKSTTPIVQK